MFRQVERAGYEAVCEAAALLGNLSLECEQGSLHYLALATQVRCGGTCAVHSGLGRWPAWADWRGVRCSG